MSSMPTEPAGGDGALPRVLVLQLRIVHAPAPAEKASVLLQQEPLVIGRGDDADLRLPDGRASRRHARVERDGSGWWIADLESRNGTFVNGERVARAALGPNAVVRIGDTLLLHLETAMDPREPLAAEGGRLLGASVAMQRVRGEIALVARRDVPVLVHGETGAGKELVAEEIHERSGRRGPLVPVNCAALPPELAESELFGHAAGAFTGAAQRKEGLLATAEGGTLFLDEIGELAPSVQPKLLRALASGEVRAVGANGVRRLDVRVVAATHVELGEAVRSGVFRDDLLARLSAWTIRVPPLRERREDVVRLALAFLEREVGPAALSADAAEVLLLHPWPRNVRELEQVVTAASIRAGGAPRLRAGHLPPELAARVAGRARSDEPGSEEPAVPLEAIVARGATPSREELELVLKRERGSVARTAEFFGKERRQIYRWAERLGVDVDSFRRGPRGQRRPSTT